MLSYIQEKNYFLDTPHAVMILFIECTEYNIFQFPNYSNFKGIG